MQKSENSAAKPALSPNEKYLIKLQNRLIDHRGSLSKYVADSTVIDYAGELARYYYPKKAANPVYLEPVCDSFLIDLLTAPRLHSFAYLWRYNYDDLDLLSNFYYFAQRRNGYFHISCGQLPAPSFADFTNGLNLLNLDLGDYAEKIWYASFLTGKRSNVARRLIENISGSAFDEQMNEEYGFAENISKRNLLKKEGRGKFRYLRRGRDWMTIGTSAHAATFDLRHTPLANLWGYGVRYDKREQKIKISVSNSNLKNCKAQISGILEAGLGAAAKLIKVNDYYRHYYNRHRFGNNTNWHELNMWLLRQTKDLRRRVEENKLK